MGNFAIKKLNSMANGIANALKRVMHYLQPCLSVKKKICNHINKKNRRSIEQKSPEFLSLKIFF